MNYLGETISNYHSGDLIIDGTVKASEAVIANYDDPNPVQIGQEDNKDPVESKFKDIVADSLTSDIIKNVNSSFTVNATGDVVCNNITTNGSSTELKSTELKIIDPIIEISKDNVLNQNTGLVSGHDTNKYRGILYNTADNKWKFFNNDSTLPTPSTAFNPTSRSDIQCNNIDCANVTTPSANLNVHTADLNKHRLIDDNNPVSDITLWSSEKISATIDSIDKSKIDLATNTANSLEIKDPTTALQYITADTTTGTEKVKIIQPCDVTGPLTIEDGKVNNVHIGQLQSQVNNISVTDVTITDNISDAYKIRQQNNNYLTMDTTNTLEKITLHKNTDVNAILNTTTLNVSDKKFNAIDIEQFKAEYDIHSSTASTLSNYEIPSSIAVNSQYTGHLKCDVDITNKRIFTANGELAIYEYSDSGTLIPKSELTLSGATTHVKYNPPNNNCYVSAGNGGLHICDVTNNSSPSLLVTKTEQKTYGALELGITTNKLYVTSGNDGFAVYNPTSGNLIHSGIYDFGANPTALKLYANESRLVVGCNGSFFIVNTSVPNKISGDVAVTGQVNKIIVDGVYAYICTSSGGSVGWLYKFDITNEASPVPIMSKQLNNKAEDMVFHHIVDVNKKYLYIATSDSVTVEDDCLSCPTAPIFVTRKIINNGTSVSGICIDETNNFLFTCESASGFRSWNYAPIMHLEKIKVDRSIQLGNELLDEADAQKINQLPTLLDQNVKTTDNVVFNNLNLNGTELNIKKDINFEIKTDAPKSLIKFDTTNTAEIIYLQAKKTYVNKELLIRNPNNFMSTSFKNTNATQPISYELPYVLPQADEVLLSDATGNLSWSSNLKNHINDATKHRIIADNDAPHPDKLYSSQKISSLIGAIPSGLVFKGSVNPSNHSLSSGVGTVGDFYIVSVDGTFSIAIDGITSVHAGDWIMFASTNVWLKLDHTAPTDASSITSGTFANARISSSSVTQHQANITGTGSLVTGSIGPGFGNINIGSNTISCGTVNGRNVATDGSNLDSLYLTLGLSGLTTVEVNQLKNIDSNVITNNNWSYLATQNQSLRTSDAPSFTNFRTTNNNVLIGDQSGIILTTENFNTCIGQNADITASNTNCIALGNGAKTVSSNECVIGNSSLTTIRSDSDVGCDLGLFNKRFRDVHCTSLHATTIKIPETTTFQLIEKKVGPDVTLLSMNLTNGLIVNGPVNSVGLVIESDSITQPIGQTTLIHPNTSSASITYILPGTVGTTGQVLTASNGSGTLEWATPTGGAPSSTYPIKNHTVSETINTSEQYHTVQTTTTSVTITLPPASTSIGRVITVQKITNNNNTMRVQASAGDSMNTGTLVDFAYPFGSITVMCYDSTSWAITSLR